jgi:SAM-dependent methyltransferase
MGLRARLLQIPLVYELLTYGLAKPDTNRWLINDVLQIAPGMRVLDVGCGTAGILSLLPEVNYLGFDVLDVNDPSFKDLGTFDRILVLGVLHHLNDAECALLMQSLSRSLSPNGRLVTFDNTLAEGQHPIARLLSKLDRGRFSRNPAGYHRIIESHFEIEYHVVRHDLMRVPYSHAAFRARTR